jgi:hypothetical protein
MPDIENRASSLKSVDALKLAKKHRISIEDASKIVEHNGDDHKAADKAARRIAA